MQEVRIATYCDYPGCADQFKKDADYPQAGQTTETVDFWFNVVGKGRKTQPIKVELCDIHKEGLRDVFLTMQKYDQNKEH